jgi:putative ABC transport system substrate-binding protein
MRRRDFFALSFGALSWPSAARAQQTPMPLVGFLRSTPSGPFANIVSAFRQGLAETGYVEGQTVEILYRWADNDLSKLPGLAAELIGRPVGVIVGNSQAAEAAGRATSSIPIVFVTSDDPVKRGLVKSLAQPGGNLTGITFFGVGALGAKRIELLHDLAPNATAIAVLIDPAFPGAEDEVAQAEAAARRLNLRIIKVEAKIESDFEPALALAIEAGAAAVLVGGSPVFTSRRKALVALVARHRLPAIYDQRSHVAAGGLISYAASFTEAYRRAGVYAGRILEGARASELPVLQPTTFELAVNLGAAKALGLIIPPSVLLRADEVIE